MIDNYGRKINYLRISLTDRCNLRCRYCMPEKGVNKISHFRVLTLEEIMRLIRVASTFNIRKIRLTGGEPLVRKNITKLITSVAEIPGIDDIAITTNGILFADMSNDLKNAGLTRVNFSLDSLDGNTFSYITRGGNVKNVMRAISKALEIGLHPVKINMVVLNGINDHEILRFAQIAYEFPLHVRFIEYMPIGDLSFLQQQQLIASDKVKAIIETQYRLLENTEVLGNGPANYYNMAGGLGTVGFISPMTNHFCSACNRIRITADGKLKNCLFSEEEINLKVALQNSASDEELAKIFQN